jgi:alpha-galactosidase
MKNIARSGFGIFAMFALSLMQCLGVTVQKSELQRADRWAAAKFTGEVKPGTPENFLIVEAYYAGSLDMGFAQDFEKNGHRGRPLRINANDYASGLFMGNAEAVAVHLTTPAKTLDAVIGLDGRSNQCGGSNQQQQFQIEVDHKVVFQSQTLEVGQAPVPVHVDLKEAKTFTLRNGSGPQWCKEAIWADAKVIFADGSQLSLGDLPVGEAAAGPDQALPFSFVYGGRPSSELLKSWKKTSSTKTLDGGLMEHQITFSDPETGLIATWIGKTYRDYPVVEWTVYFENSGSVASPILEKIRAVDTSFERRNYGEFNLHHFRGSPSQATDFEPFQTELAKGSTLRLATSGGRPTDKAMCYFNLEEQQQGVIVALGWPGQWDADFIRDSGRTVRLQAGQELTHFKLQPGEKVRSPLVALLFWNGDWIRGQNLWRKWMLAYNVPHFSDGTIQPHLAGTSAYWTNVMADGNEENQKLFINRYRAAGIKLDFWWMDAGWYINDGSWVNTGTWKIDLQRFPNGLRPVTDLAHSMGLQTIVWFELERATRDSALWKEHPDWLLKDLLYEKRGFRLLNLGLPDVQRWVVDLLDRYITEQGIDVYRIDFNIEPLAFWRNNDTPDRQGMTEMRYVEGFLWYLDELKKRHPKLVIDTCASGGRRDDLETLRRAVPMHRTDYNDEPVGSQNIGFGSSFWVPYSGGPDLARDDYVFRSAWSPQTYVAWDVRKSNLDFDWMRKAVAQWRSVAPDMLGDFYPLLPYNSTDTAWMAWQFDNDEKEKGFLQAFRRENSAVAEVRLKLHGLDPGSQYQLTNLDTQSSETHSGAELTSIGLSVEMQKKASSQVIVYHKVP